MVILAKFEKYCAIYYFYFYYVQKTTNKTLIIEFGFMVWHMKLQRQDLSIYTTQFAEEANEILFNEFGINQNSITIDICEQIYLTLILHMQ